jgi:hypothetical protein
VRGVQIRFVQKHLIERDARIEVKHVEIFSRAFASYRKGLAMESQRLSAASVSSGANGRGFRVARAVLMSAFLSFTIATYSLLRLYQSTRPAFLDQPSGQLHALNAGSWTVYVTRTDQVRVYGLAVAAAVCLVGAVALDTFVPG